MTINIDDIVRGLQGRRSGNSWVACCPAHDDHTPSLTIRESNGKILVRCHAGCTQAEVIDALRLRGLWPETERREWARPFVDPDHAGDMLRAAYWARSVVMLAEWLLEDLPLTDPARVPLTNLLRVIRLGDDVTLRAYRSWRESHPNFTAGLVYAGRLSDAKLQQALARWIHEGMHGKFP